MPLTVLSPTAGKFHNCRIQALPEPGDAGSKFGRRSIGSLTDSRLVVTVDDLGLMQGLAQRIAATRPELVNSDATYGELAWVWGKGHITDGHCWRHRLWFDAGELVAWGWAAMPHGVRCSDGVVRQISEASMTVQVHPDHAALIDEVIDWYDEVADGLARTALPRAADAYGLARWAAHGYRPDPAMEGDTGYWTELNARDLDDIEAPVLPDGFRFRTAEEVSPEAVVQAHIDAWAPSTYTAEGYHGVRQTPSYWPNLHMLVEAPDGTMASSTIMWLDPVNRSAEFEPVGTYPDYRRMGLARAMLLHAMHAARDAGARHMTVACLGAPGHRNARGLYRSVGFQAFSRDWDMRKDV
jgi:ribosomal protein S18 acetylase RimI-like enzyme